MVTANSIVHAPAEIPLAHADDYPITPSALSVIAIDDNQLDLQLLRRLLAEISDWRILWHGYTASEPAFAAIEETAPDIIFLDYHLQGEVGLEVLKRLRQVSSACPIVTLTGGGDENIATQMLRHGANDYVIKDQLTPEVLRSVIAGALTEVRLKREMAVLQEELLESRKMEAMATLTAGIANDFKSEVYALVGHLKLALNNAQTEETRGYIQGALESSQRLEEMVERLRKVGVRRLKDPVVLDLGEQLEQAVSLIKHQFPGSLMFDIVVLEKDNLRILGTQEGLQQILSNLCRNAAEAMGGKGTVNILAARIRQGSEVEEFRPSYAANEDIYLEVRDSGAGISARDLSRIFHPYFTTKSAALGNRGLGLSIVWNQVNSFGGVIKVDSRPGHGTVVRMFFPSTQ